jgi:hypothetical protein
VYVYIHIYFCRLHYWEESLLPRDPSWHRAWALLFDLIHIWWDKAPYRFRWVEHNSCCSWPAQMGDDDGWLLDLLRAVSFSTSGLFWMVWDSRSSSFDTICMFSIVAFRTSVLWISDSSLTTQCLLYIFLYVFNLWRTKKAL